MAVPRSTAGRGPRFLPRRPQRGDFSMTAGVPPSRSRFAMTSAMPKSPMATGTKPMPSASCGMPNVKRVWPEAMSVPTSPSSEPGDHHGDRAHDRALGQHHRGDQAEHQEAEVVGRLERAGDPRPAARRRARRPALPTQPAKNEPSAAMASAAPARPLRAIMCPSMQVTTEELSPGILTRIAVVEPPYWAP